MSSVKQTIIDNPAQLKPEATRPRGVIPRKSYSLSVYTTGLFYVMNITFKLALFADRKAIVIGRGGGLKRKGSEKALLFLLESLVNIDRMEIRQNRLPPLYKAGVRYVREKRGDEDWQDTITLYRRGVGDCEDLGCTRVAELRNNGKRASPYIRWRLDPETGIYIYHVLVLRGSGRLEDPSRILGMK